MGGDGREEGYVGLVHLCINQHTKFELPNFTNSKDMIGGKFKKTGHVTLTTPNRG